MPDSSPYTLTPCPVLSSDAQTHSRVAGKDWIAVSPAFDKVAVSRHYSTSGLK